VKPAIKSAAAINLVIWVSTILQSQSDIVEATRFDPSLFAMVVHASERNQVTSVFVLDEIVLDENKAISQVTGIVK